MPLLAQIEEKLARLQALRPLEPAEVRVLEERVVRPFELEVIATSNQIEGNSLTLRETEMVLSKGMTIAGKPLKDHLEAINLSAAFDYLKHIATTAEPITCRLVRELHQMVLSRLDDAWAGVYRTVPVRIAGAAHLPPAPLDVPRLMQDWENSLASSHGLHPVHLAADAYEKLVTIHPFVDGNGRTSRLLMNLVFLRAGYPAIVIPSDSASRTAYYDALENTQTGAQPHAFREFIARATSVMLHRYLETLAPAVSR
jgi:Fic family protein